MYTVKVLHPGGQAAEMKAVQGMSLLSLLRSGGFFLPSPCGGKGVCGKCKVLVLSGADTLQQPYLNTKAVSAAEWESGYRLSCRMKVLEDLTLSMPEQKEEGADILTSGSYTVDLNPSVSVKEAVLTTPDLKDQTGDADRLEQALTPARIQSPNLLQQLPALLRANGFAVSAAVYGNTILDVQGISGERACYGVAVDIGTTTIAGVLINLLNGREECVYSALNPQKLHGDDVITRIDYTLEHTEGLSVLKSLIREEIKKMLRHFTRETGIRQQNIYHMVLVGNTVMMHLFAGLPVRHIAVVPFVPVVSRSVELSAAELDIPICPEGRITIAPMVAGYVGADTVAAILASGMHQRDKTALLIDIGTNGEIALGSRTGILACSTAAGPAFEGGHIRCGLGGVTGAINRITLQENRVELSTIGDAPAKGICGSGVVDGTAQLLKWRLLEPYGRLISGAEAADIAPDWAPRMVEAEGKPAFLVAAQQEGAAADIVITQKDIREIQLAKGAIAAGIRILLDEMGIGLEDIDQVHLAGGFGNYIDYDHAVEIGLLPKALRDRILPIGNGALTGAKMILLNHECKKQAEAIKALIRYIELSSRADFQTLFVQYMTFE